MKVPRSIYKEKMDSKGIESIFSRCNHSAQVVYYGVPIIPVDKCQIVSKA